MKPLRVIQLVSTTSLGGVQVLVEMIETGLSNRGMEVITLSLGTSGGPLHRLRHLAGVLWTVATARADAILTYHAAASVLGCSLAALVRIPIRAAHQTAIPSATKPLWRGLDRFLGSIGVYTSIVSNSSATTATFAHYPERYRSRFLLIPHGVNPASRSHTHDWRRELAIPADATVLVATGRLTDQKNHRVAVHALGYLLEAHLVIAGEGPNRAALETAAALFPGRVHLLGEVPHAEIGDVLAAADIYVFPSIWETFGLSGVEAGMAGLPIVAANLPVLREVLDFYPYGDLVCLHPADYPLALAEAVRSMHPTLGQRLRQAARFRARHGAEVMIARYCALLAENLPTR